MPKPRPRRAAPVPDADTSDVWAADTRLLENEVRDRLERIEWMRACKVASADPRSGSGSDAFAHSSRARIAEGHRPPRGLPEDCYLPGRVRPGIAWLDQLSPAGQADLLADGPVAGWRPAGRPD